MVVRIDLKVSAGESRLIWKALHMLEYYTAIVAVSVLVCIILIVVVQSNVLHPRKSKGLFTALYSVVAVCAVCEYLGHVIDGSGPMYGSLVLIIKFIEYCCAPSLAILYCAVLAPTGSKRIKVGFILVAVHALFQLVCLPFGLVIRLDATGAHYHGPLYIIYVLAYLASAVFIFNETRLLTMRNQCQARMAPLLILVFSLSGILTQSFLPDVRLSWLTLSVGGVFFYLFYCSVLEQTDALTALLNRHSYENAIWNIDQRAALVVFDINNFKSVNDEHGHQVGDACLRDVGRAMVKAYGRFGSCYRIGGDEFCVILLSALDRIEELNAEFQKSLDELREENPALPGVSVGHAIYNPACDVKEEVFLAADEMMYGHKKARPSAC